MSKKKLNKKVWYSSEVDVSGNPILPPLAENPEDLNGLHEGELFLHNSDEYPSIWIRTKSGLVKPLNGGKSSTPSYWEVREFPNGGTYLYTSLPIVTQSGVTMYADGGNLNLPSIYDGLPIDNNTIYWEDVDGYRVLKAKGGGGIAESVSWADITGKPEWLLDGKISYSEIEGTPDLSVYALKRSLSEYVTKTELTNLDYADKDWVKEYVVDINTGNITAITKQMVIEALGYTPYDNANPNGYVTSESIPSLDGYATEDWVIKKGYLTSIPSEYITESELTAKGYATALSVNTALGNKVDKVDGKGLSTEDFTTALKTKLEGLNNYNDTAISNAVTKLRNDFDALVEGDTSTAIDNFNEIIAFLNGVQDNQDLSSIIASIEQQIAAKYTKPSGGIPKSDLVQAVQTSLGKADSALQSHQSIYTLTFQSGTFASGSFTANSGNKTINIPTTTSHVSEGNNLYFTNARAVSALGDTLKSYVTLSGSQTVSGEKNFTGGFKVNGSPIVYDAAKKYWKLEGDLLITGGLTMYGSDSSFTPSTIMDAIAVDGTTISKEGGVLKVIGGGGAITSITKQMVVNALGFTPISSSDIPTALPNPHSLKFGSKLYDGSASKTILASDLGALTAHQTIYALTVKNSEGTTQLTYTPNSGTGSLTLTKAMVGLGNVDNLAASGYLTALSSNTTNAVSITVGGTTKSITSATMKTSLGLGSLAYKSSLTASDIPNLDWSKITSGKPTTLSGYGITDAKISNGVITLGSSSITPLTVITTELVTDALGYTPYNAANFTKANIKSTLGISDWALAASKPSYTWDDILGRPTLLSSFTDDVVAGKYLPLSGGTITSSEGVPLNINSTAGYTIIRLQINGINYSIFGADEYWGTYLGVSGKNQRLGIKPDGTPYYNEYSLIHTGNYSSYALPLSGGTMNGNVVWKAGTGHNSILPGHIYRNLHGSSGNVYDHYHPLSFQPTNTFANLRVWCKDNNTHRALRFGGDGTFTWDGQTVIHSGNIGSQSVNYANNALRMETVLGHIDGTSIHDLNTVIGGGDVYNYGDANYWRNAPTGIKYGRVWNLAGSFRTDLLNGQLAWDINHNSTTDTTSGLWWRAIQNADRVSYAKWHQIAFTDSDITGNAASATRARYIETQMPNSDDWYADRYRAYTRWGSDNYSILDWKTEGDYPVRVDIAKKLNTARTIWGQSFDGSGNVSGSINLGKNVIGYSLSEVWTDDEGNTHPWYGLDFSTPSKFATLSNWYGINLRVGDNCSVTIPSGNVGIGTTNPSAKLDVIGGAIIHGMISIYDGWGIKNTTEGWRLLTDGYMGDVISNGGVELYSSKGVTLSAGSVAKSLHLNSSGNVGIGITSPSQKLHVDGNILTTGGVTMYSMRSLKNVVDERGLSLTELSAIKPTRYTWKDGRDNRTHFGGIADDIQQVLPEVVYNANGVLTMDYGNAGFAIASSLIKPVVDHEQRIKALEKENEELKERLNRYEA